MLCLLGHKIAYSLTIMMLFSKIWKNHKGPSKIIMATPVEPFFNSFFYYRNKMLKWALKNIVSIGFFYSRIKWFVTLSNIASSFSSLCNKT